MAYASRSQQRGFQGVTKLRRTLRRLDPELTQEIRDLVTEAGKDLEADIKRYAVNLKRTDAMYDSIGYKVSRDGFTVIAGVEAPSTKIQGRVVLGKIARKTTKSGRLTLATSKKLSARMNIYKAIYHEFGTKGAPDQNIGPLMPTYMHQKAFNGLKPGMQAKFAKAIDKALRSAASG